MKNFSEFILEHCDDDVLELILHKEKWPEIDVNLAATTIQGRRKMRTKAPRWFECEDIIYPNTLCTEQCSSMASAALKATLLPRPCERVADLTGGLGIDSWAFSQVAEQVLYVEMLPELAQAAEHNFAALGAGNVRVVNASVGKQGDGVTGRQGPQGLSTDVWEVLRDFAPQVIYLDPARRSAAGSKVFKLEECQPNILELREPLLNIASTVMVKLSPMADIDAVCKALGEQVSAVDVVSVDGECKELLITMVRMATGSDPIIRVHCLESDRATKTPAEAAEAAFSFTRAEEATATPGYVKDPDSLLGSTLLEPDKALMKAAPFKLLSARLGLEKLDVSTHYKIGRQADRVTGRQGPQGSRTLFKEYHIIEIARLDKRAIKSISEKYPRAEVTARNIPMTTEQLRSRLGVKSSDTHHIFGLKIHGIPHLIITTIQRA